MGRAWYRAATGLGLWVLVATGLIGCSASPSPWVAGKSPRVLASFPPLYCFAANVVTDDAQVLSLLTTTGPHEYKPTTLAPILVKEATVFFANGLGLDDTFCARLKNSTSNLKLHYVEIGKTLPKDRLRKLTEEERVQEHHGHTHAHGIYDPHVWLGIPEAILMVQRLRDELKQVDPARAAAYEQNAATYVEQLKELQAEGVKRFAGFKPEDRQLITMHDSLAYFARTFGLEIVGSIQPRPGVEQDPAQMAKLVELCKSKKVRIVAFEPQYPKNAAETLIKSVATDKSITPPRNVVLDPLETANAEELGKDWYIKKMRENLDNLEKALR